MSVWFDIKKEPLPKGTRKFNQLLVRVLIEKDYDKEYYFEIITYDFCESHEPRWNTGIENYSSGDYSWYNKEYRKVWDGPKTTITHWQYIDPTGITE